MWKLLGNNKWDFAGVSKVNLVKFGKKGNEILLGTILFIFTSPGPNTVPGIQDVLIKYSVLTIFFTLEKHWSESGPSYGRLNQMS